MTDIALQIGPDGFSFSIMPEDLDIQAVTSRAAKWPTADYGGRLPVAVYERCLGFRLLSLVLDDSKADVVLLAIEEGTDLRRIGALETAFEDLDVGVIYKDAHPEGALGIMREAVQEFIDEINAMPPPGM
jgi:hypothetical protein